MVDGRKMSSVLGESSVVLGNVEGSGDLEVRGTIQGDVVLNGRLLIASTGTILGSVEAVHTTVSGQLTGDLRASDGVVITAEGTVVGNVDTPRIAIETGAHVRGLLNTASASRDSATRNSATRDPASRDSATRDSATRDPASRDPASEDAPLAIAEVAAQDERPEEPRSDSPRPKKRRKRRRGQSTAQSAPPNDAELEASPARERATDPKRAITPLREAATLIEAASPPEAASAPDLPRVTKARRGARRGPPRLPTFVKGAKGRVKNA